jgi:hypothetical protein
MDRLMALLMVSDMVNRHLLQLLHLDVARNLDAHLVRLHLVVVLRNLGELNPDGCLPLADALLGEAGVVLVGEE